ERHYGRTQSPPRKAEQAIRGHAIGTAVPGRATVASTAAAAGDGSGPSARRALQQRPARLQRRQKRSGGPGTQRLYQVLPEHRSRRERIFLSSRNSVQGRRLPKSG